MGSQLRDIMHHVSTLQEPEYPLNRDVGRWGGVATARSPSPSTSPSSSISSNHSEEQDTSSSFPFVAETKMPRTIGTIENGAPVFSASSTKTSTLSTATSLHGKFYAPRIHAVIQEAKKLFDHRLTINPVELDMTALREKMAAIRPEDVGDRLSILSRGEVGYLSLEDNSNFTIGVFFLAPGSQIPLHDHPEMCVLSQLVKGAVHVKSFDFDLTADNKQAYLVDDGLYKAPTTRVLYPTTGGNLHSFATKTGCIIVDVMSPPYDEFDGRECTYFKASDVGNRFYRMEPMPPPEDFEVLDLS